MEVILQQSGALLVCAATVIASPAKPSLGGQVLGLLVGSIPTALLFLVLVVAYEFLVHKPLTATLTRRRALTEGAMEEASGAIARAEAQLAEYAEKLRRARAEIYLRREQRMKQWNAERETTLEAARKGAREKIDQARAGIDAEAAAARQSVQASAAELARLAIRAVLPAAAGGSR